MAVDRLLVLGAVCPCERNAVERGNPSWQSDQPEDVMNKKLEGEKNLSR